MKRALSIASLGLALMLLPSVASAAGSGKILGTVTPTSIAPEVEVCLVETRPSETCASPAADGTYELRGVPLAPIRIEFIPSYRSRYAVQYYEHSRTLAGAATISLTSVSPERQRVDADLELGGAIEGTVTAAVGRSALPGVEVCVLEAGQRTPHGCTDTDEAGEYSLGGLPAGAYKVGFWGHGQSSEYASQYYDGEATFGAGTAVSVVAGGTETGIDAEMMKGARVSGTVTAAVGGGGLGSVPVCLFAVSAPTPTQCVYTEASGAYALLGVAAGSYQVGFSLGSAEIGGEAISSEVDGYATQYYRGVANRAEAQILSLSGEEAAAGIDAALSAPLAPPSVIPPAPLATPATPAPTIVTAPSKSVTKACKRGFVKRKVKGAVKCVRKVTKKKTAPKRKHPKKRTHDKKNNHPKKKRRHA